MALHSWALLVADAYLILAERILLAERRPLTPREILDIGYALEMVPWHLHGETQHKTLHARLSEDVSSHQEESKFFRTGPGEFFLKALLEEPSTPNEFKAVFRAPPRGKELKKESVLAISAAGFLTANEAFSCISIDHISEQLNAGHYVFRAWKELEKTPEYIPIHSFVVVHKDDDVLSFKSGKFRPKSDPLYGSCSIGFGGLVFASDIDLVFNSFFGVIGNGIKELVSSLGLTRRLAEKARYAGELHTQLATLVKGKKEGARHLNIVLSYRCPNEFSPTKNTLSLNDLRWISARGVVNDPSRYDATSRYLLEGDILRKITTAEASLSH